MVTVFPSLDALPAVEPWDVDWLWSDSLPPKYFNSAPKEVSHNLLVDVRSILLIDYDIR